MKKLDLPEPAATLWRRSKGTLTRLGPGGKPWRICLGGGTVLAARYGHRTSTDLDVTLPDRQNLSHLMSWSEDSLAARLNGSPADESERRVVVRRELGMIDVNTAPIRPPTGHEEVEIDGQIVAVMSTTQILTGKLQRNLDKNPIRDAIDVVQAESAADGRRAITAATGQFMDDELDQIKAGMLTTGANDYEMMDRISIAPALRRPPSELRGEAVTSIENNRARRVLFRLKGDELTVETHTNRGEIFPNDCPVDHVEETCARLGLNGMLARNGAAAEDVRAKARTCIHNRLDGVIFDTDE